LSAEPVPEQAAKSESAGTAMDLRTFGTGAQVLRALGVRQLRVLGAPRMMHGLSGVGLEVVEYMDYG
jgi:3,4-dihydroxy 2-butanone 4-phosphate synthase/GTP cyclohydrolase II